MPMQQSIYLLKQHGYPLYQGRNVLRLSMMINVMNEMDTLARIARAFVWTLLGLWVQSSTQKKKVPTKYNF